MFDTAHMSVGGASQSVTFNSVAGTLIKSTAKSKFKRFHMNSPMADTFFDIRKPHWKEADYPYKKTYIKVLQTMLCGGEQFLVEYIEVDEE